MSATREDIWEDYQVASFVHKFLEDTGSPMDNSLPLLSKNNKISDRNRLLRKNRSLILRISSTRK